MSANPVVDPAQLERLRHLPGCKKWDADVGNRHEWADQWSDQCDACLALLAAAVEEQTIERCAKQVEVCMDAQAEGYFEMLPEDAVRLLPRQWGSTPEEAR